jgi:ABC-2 type transport system permease protein
LSQAFSILLLLLLAVLHAIGAIEQHFFLFGLPPDLVFSDFRVMAASNARHLSFDAWYLGFTGILALLAIWLWPRGNDTGIGQRLRERMRHTSLAGVALLLLACCSLAAGGLNAYRQLHVEHRYISAKQQMEDASSYEKRYSFEDELPQPHIQALTLRLRIEPLSRSMQYDGVWKLVNDNAMPVDHLHLDFPRSPHTPELKIGDTVTAPENWDPIHFAGTWRLPRPLEPRETISIGIRARVDFQGFEEKPFEGTIGDDTAWFDTSLLPCFGYDRAKEIDATVQRSEHSLPPRRNRVVRENVLAANKSAGWVDLDASVTAPADWVVAGAEGPSDHGTVHITAKHVPLALQIVAGRLVVQRATLASSDGRGIPVGLYFRDGHGENAARMLQILQQAFAEWERRFGPYPLSRIDLAEVPQYQSGGERDRLVTVRTAAGLIAMPERLGWLHDYRAEPARDWLTFILSAELSRAWWGGSVAAREGPGSALIDDGAPMLLGLTMLEKQHGIQAADDYAKLLQDRYRREAARENGPIPSLIDTNFEEYAGLQAALALFQQRRTVGSQIFDQHLDQIWTHLSAAHPAKPNSPGDLAAELGLPSPKLKRAKGEANVNDSFSREPPSSRFAR